MNEHTDPPPIIELPTHLSGEAAALLLELLYQLAHNLEALYAEQLHRYYHRPDDRQVDIFEQSDPPF